MKKVFSSVIAFIIAAALVIAVGVGSAWFSNWNVKTWFNSWGKGGETVAPDNPDKPITGDKSNGGGALIGGFENDGISLLSAELPFAAYAANGVSEKAEKAYILAATTIPETATNFLVDWSIAWVNGESEWATDKTVTDYVSLVEQDNIRAVVSVLAPFAEQVKITVVSRDNPEAKASCVCDYVQRLSYDYAENDMSTLCIYKDTATADYPFSVYAYTDYGIGTVQGSLNLVSVSLNLDEVTYNALNHIYAGACFNYSYGSTDYATITKNNENCFDIIFGGANYLDTIFGLYDDNGAVMDGNPTDNILLAYLRQHTVGVVVNLTFEYTYKIGDKVVYLETFCDGFEDSLKLSDCVGYKIPVSGLNISDTHIVF